MFLKLSGNPPSPPVFLILILILIPLTIAGTAEMPFPEKPDSITKSAEDFGDGLNFERQLERHPRINQLRKGPPVAGNMLDDAEARFVLTTLEVGSRQPGGVAR